MIPAYAWSQHSALKCATAVSIQPVGIWPEKVVGILPGRHSGRLPFSLLKANQTHSICSTSTSLWHHNWLPGYATDQTDSYFLTDSNTGSEQTSYREDSGHNTESTYTDRCTSGHKSGCKQSEMYKNNKALGRNSFLVLFAFLKPTFGAGLQFSLVGLGHTNVPDSASRSHCKLNRFHLSTYLLIYLSDHRVKRPPGVQGGKLNQGFASIRYGDGCSRLTQTL